MQDVLSLSARRMTALLRANEISSEELTHAVIARIEAVNPTLNAVMTLDAEPALEAARQIDSQRLKGADTGPLAGLPMTIKDSFETAGLISTAGTPGRHAYVPQRDATAVARLRAAGAVIVGKSSTPELTLRFETANRLIGQTCNPHDLRRSPGGSSGGAAALIAAQASPCDIGSDTGGSIRVPAHFCGIAGLKPTAGRVSRAGHIPHLHFPLVESFTQIGPLARRVEDLGLLYPLLCGADPLDPFAVNMPLAQTAPAIAGMAVTVYHDNGRTPPCARTIEALGRAAAILEDSGAQITQARPPGAENAPELWHQLFEADGGHAVRALLSAFGTDTPDPLISWTQDRDAVSVAGLNDLVRAWADLRIKGLEFLRSAQCILCPVSAEAAPIVGQASPLDYTQLYNLLGWPVVVVRCGTSDTGLPIGLQIAAPPWREDICLAIGTLLEDRLTL